jgi:hypothetical protein
MTVVDELLRRYVAEHRAAGDADPGPYLERVRGADRAELAALIDGFLAQAPQPPFDPVEFARFRSDPRRRALADRLLDDATLRQLRQAAGVSKAQVGSRLAAALGLEGHEQQVKARYHDIEQGWEDPDRVRQRVWEALARLFGAPLERVRAAAAAAFEGGLESPVVTPVFARADLLAAAPALVDLDAAVDPGSDVVERALFED